MKELTNYGQSKLSIWSIFVKNELTNPVTSKNNSSCLLPKLKLNFFNENWNFDSIVSAVMSVTASKH